MSWKSNARSIPVSHMRAQLEKDAKENGVPQYVPGEGNWRKPNPFIRLKQMEIRHGRPYVVNDHIRDLHLENEETGKKYVAASARLRRGQYVFPTHYLHPKKRFVGEVKDIRHTKNGWEIYLDGVLRDFVSGKPVLFDGLEIDCSGWYVESDLQDAKMGLKPIKPGATLPSENQIIAKREERIRRNARR